MVDDRLITVDPPSLFVYNNLEPACENLKKIELEHKMFKPSLVYTLSIQYKVMCF